MSGWLDLTQSGLAPNQKHQALLGAPKIVHCGEPKTLTKTKSEAADDGGLSRLFRFLCQTLLAEALTTHGMA